MGRQIPTAVFVAVALATPLVAHAECVSVTLPKGQRYAGPVAKPTLVFSGTVTAADSEKYTVSFIVDRVWTGQLHRNTTIVVAPVVEGAQATSFQTGEAYLVTAYSPIYVFSANDVAATGVAAGTLGVAFGCGDGPVPLADAKELLKSLGRGRAPAP